MKHEKLPDFILLNGALFERELETTVWGAWYSKHEPFISPYETKYAYIPEPLVLKEGSYWLALDETTQCMIVRIQSLKNVKNWKITYAYPGKTRVFIESQLTNKEM